MRLQKSSYLCMTSRSRNHGLWWCMMAQMKAFHTLNLVLWIILMCFESNYGKIRFWRFAFSEKISIVRTSAVFFYTSVIHISNERSRRLDLGSVQAYCIPKKLESFWNNIFSYSSTMTNFHTKQANIISLRFPSFI